MENKRYPSLAELMTLKGNARRGRKVFRSKKAACTTCHAVEGAGREVGPNLAEAGDRFDRRELFDAILNPSAGIAQGFEAVMIDTEDFRSITGFIRVDGETVVIQDTAGQSHAIPREEIISRRKLTLSVMPDNIALGIAPQRLADLVTYLQSLSRR